MFDLGGIKYTVTADTAAMLRAEAVVNRSISNQVSAFSRADTAVRDYTRTQTELGRTINSMGQVIDSNGDIVASATLQYRRLSEAAQRAFQRAGNAAAATTPQMNGVAAAVNNAGAGARRSRFDMQNMSYQLQDMAVQAQMGTSAFVIMSQQIPQMLVGMGAWAGAIGVAVTVLGLLATTMINTTSDATLLNQAIERTKAVMTVGTGGIVEYTQQMQELGRVSEVVAQYRVKAAMVDAQKTMKLTVKSMGTEMSKLNDGDIMTNFNDAIKYSDQLSGRFSGRIGEYAKFIGKQLGFADEEAKKMGSQFLQAFKSLESAKTEKEVTNIQEKLIGLATQTGKADKKFTDMFSNVLDSFDELRSGAAVIDAANAGIENLSNKANEAKGAVESMTQQLIQERVALEGGERAALEYSLQLQGMSEEQKKSILTLYDYNKGLIKQKEATEETIKKDKERKKSIDDINDSLDAFFENESKQSELEESKKIATLTQKVETIGIDPLQAIKDRYDKELELLEEHKQKVNDIEINYKERSERIAKQKAEAVSRYNAREAGNVNMTMSNTLQAMGSISNAFGSIVNSMDKSSKESFDKWKKYALVQAVISTAMGIANALATPAPWPVAAAMGIAAGVAGAVQIATIQGQSYSGAREYGGPVTAGKSYLVGERGPEMFTPNTSGGVTSNKDMMTAASNEMSVQINNYSPYEVYVTQDQAKQLAIVEINTEAGRLRQGRGNLNAAMSGNGNYRTNGRR